MTAEAARERLRLAVADLVLTDKERATLVWIERWDASTIEAIASIIEKARAQQ